MAGRGRGYAARHKNKQILSEAAATVIADNPKMEKTTQLEEMFKDGASEPNMDADSLKELLYIDECHKPILAQLERITPGEDGIVFNRKLKELESTIITKCSNHDEIRSVFSACRASALRSEVACRRLSCVAAALSRSLNPVNLRSAFLSVMQETYDKLDVLERGTPSLLINAANLLGDYYYEARLSDGGAISVIAAPVVGYLRSLLATSDPKAHRSLATQLMKIGRQLLSALPSEIDKLSIDIRCRILSLIPSASTVWLLLASDLCINKFLPLPVSLERFYTTHLDLTRDEPSEMKNGDVNCRIKQNEHYDEVSYGSWRNSPEEKFDNSPENANKTESLYVDTSDVDIINDSIEHLNVSVANSKYDDSSEIRKPRAILGAGARKSHTRSESNPVELSANRDNDESFWNQNEFNRNTNESNHKSMESSRRTHDTSIKSDDPIEKYNESSHKLNDSSYNSNEPSHKTNDSTRTSYDMRQNVNDSTRKSYDVSYNQNESSRKSYDMSHNQNEPSRKSYDMSHNQNESSRKSYDVSHNTNESSRKSADRTRKSNDSIRKTNDSVRRTTPLLRRYDLNSWRQDDNSNSTRNQYGEIDTQNYTSDNSTDNVQRTVKYKEKSDRSSHGNEWKSDDKLDRTRRTSESSHATSGSQKLNASTNLSNSWRNSSNNKDRSHTTEDYDRTDEENVESHELGDNSWESEKNIFEEKKKVVKKHVTDVPRGSKYWGHDDRLDHDYDN